MKQKLKTKLQFEFDEFLEIPEINFDLNSMSKNKSIKIIKKKKGKFKCDASTRLF